MNKKGKQMLTYALLFAAAVLVVTALIVDHNDNERSLVDLSEKKSQLDRLSNAISDLHESQKLANQELQDTIDNQKQLADRLYKIEKAQTDLSQKVTESEKHLDLRISKLPTTPKRSGFEVQKVEIVGPITLERVVAAPVKKSLGKGINSVIQEQAK